MQVLAVLVPCVGVEMRIPRTYGAPALLSFVVYSGGVKFAKTRTLLRTDEVVVVVVVVLPCSSALGVQRTGDQSVLGIVCCWSRLFCVGLGWCARALGRHTRESLWLPYTELGRAVAIFPNDTRPGHGRGVWGFASRPDRATAAAAVCGRVARPYAVVGCIRPGLEAWPQRRVR